MKVPNRFEIDRFALLLTIDRKTHQFIKKKLVVEGSTKGYELSIAQKSVVSLKCTFSVDSMIVHKICSRSCNEMCFFGSFVNTQCELTSMRVHKETQL